MSKKLKNFSPIILKYDKNNKSIFNCEKFWENFCKKFNQEIDDIGWNNSVWKSEHSYRGLFISTFFEIYKNTSKHLHTEVFVEDNGTRADAVIVGSKGKGKSKSVEEIIEFKSKEKFYWFSADADADASSCALWEDFESSSPNHLAAAHEQLENYGSLKPKMKTALCFYKLYVRPSKNMSSKKRDIENNLDNFKDRYKSLVCSAEGLEKNECFKEITNVVWLPVNPELDVISKNYLNEGPLFEAPSSSGNREEVVKLYAGMVAIWSSI